MGRITRNAGQISTISALITALMAVAAYPGVALHIGAAGVMQAQQAASTRGYGASATHLLYTREYTVSIHADRAAITGRAIEPVHG